MYITDLMAEAGNGSGKTLLCETIVASSFSESASQRGCKAQGAVPGARYLPTTHQPSYLAELLRVHVHRRDLRSGNYQRLLIPRNKLKFTDRAFSHSAPTIWNGLPTSVNFSSTLEHFKRSLKTELYNRAFNRN